MPDFKAIILAGGSGERFWPLSTPENPKQFLRVFGGESLIRQSVGRLAGLVKPEDVFVVTAKDLVATTRRELPELPAKNVIGEPMRRDTGAAIALGVGMASIGSLGSLGSEGSEGSLGSEGSIGSIKSIGSIGARGSEGLNGPNVSKCSSDPKDPVIGFFPSDQMVMDPVKFRKTVKRAIALANRKSTIVTIGIKPNYPATGFGYVDPKTGQFVEKPDERKAKTYLKRGYLWNAGMFIARASTFRAAFAVHAPALLPLVSSRVSRLKSLYLALPKISFDYAVMEKLAKVEVVRGDFGWDDVGSYSAFDRYFPHDSRGNVREGPCTVVEADGNICVARSARISLLGVKNLVVVTTPDAVLVADKGRVAEMKKLFAKK